MAREYDTDPNDSATVRRSAEHRRAEDLGAWLGELFQGRKVDKAFENGTIYSAGRPALVR
jgi:hypothetical protein